jgi:hypothetical protein
MVATAEASNGKPSSSSTVYRSSLPFPTTGVSPGTSSKLPDPEAGTSTGAGGDGGGGDGTGGAGWAGAWLAVGCDAEGAAACADGADAESTSPGCSPYGTGCSLGALFGGCLAGGATNEGFEAASVLINTANAQLAMTNRINRRRRSRRARLRSACRSTRKFGRLGPPRAARSTSAEWERGLGAGPASEVAASGNRCCRASPVGPPRGFGRTSAIIPFIDPQL